MQTEAQTASDSREPIVQPPTQLATIGSLQSQVVQMQVTIDQLVQSANTSNHIIEYLRQEVTIQNQQAAMTHSVLLAYATRLNSIEQLLGRGSHLTRGLLSASTAAQPTAAVSGVSATSAMGYTGSQIVNLDQIGTLLANEPTNSNHDSKRRKKS